MLIMWQRQGKYEYEYNAITQCYTGRCRYVGGRLKNGTWPVFG